MHNQAAINTFKLICFMITGSLLTLFFFTVIPTAYILYILGVTFFCYMIYIFYSIEKSRLEYHEKLKEMMSK